VLPVNVMAPEDPVPDAANCPVMPVGRPLMATVGVPVGPAMVTGTWTAAPSCGTTTLALPIEAERTGGTAGVIEPPPHPAPDSARPRKAMPRIGRNDRSWKVINDSDEVCRLVYAID
jgi:hypothetical protein